MGFQINLPPAMVHPALLVCLLSFVEPPLEPLLQPPLLDPIATMQLRRGLSQGGSNISSLAPCGLELSALSALRIGADSSVNEETVQLKAACTTCGGGGCVISSPLRFEHGVGELVRLMPSTFQLPPDGARLYGQPELVEGSPQHERAAAVAVRAERWVSLSVRTLMHGPNKWALRSLLFGLSLALITVCVCAALIKFVSVALSKA